MLTFTAWATFLGSGWNNTLFQSGEERVTSPHLRGKLLERLFGSWLFPNSRQTGEKNPSSPKFLQVPLPGKQSNPGSRQDINRFPDSRTVFWSNPEFPIITFQTLIDNNEEMLYKCNFVIASSGIGCERQPEIWLRSRTSKRSRKSQTKSGSLALVAAWTLYSWGDWSYVDRHSMSTCT